MKVRKGIIYKIINKTNNYTYVGQTIKQGRFFDNYWGSGVYIKRAIKKYGIENFKKIILESGSVGQINLDIREKYWIEQENSLFPNGYNISKGGKGRSGFTVKFETVEKLRKTFKERGVNLGEKNGMFGKEPLNKGKKQSKESIEANRKWHIGRTGKLCPNSKKVYQYDKFGNYINIFYSVKEAKRLTGINNISTCCTGKQKTAGGFIWSYLYFDSQYDFKIVKKYFKPIRSIEKFNLKGELLETFNSIKEAKLKNKGDINRSLKCGNPTNSKVIWKYKENK